MQAQGNARECSAGQTSVNCFSVQPHAGAPKRKLAIVRNMGFYGRQFAIRLHTYMHTHTHTRRGAPRDALAKFVF